MRMFHGVSVSRAAWDEWNSAMRDPLINSQDTGIDEQHAHQKGSWYNPRDPVVAQYGGRLMQTSLSILMLQTYYRYPPLIDKAIKEE
jgi:hypothetical protein